MSAALDAALALIADLDSIEQRRRLLDHERSAAIEAAKAKFAATCQDSILAAELFSALYWSLPDMGAELLASLLGSNYRYGHGDIKPAPFGTGVRCGRCNTELTAKSRTEHQRIVREDRRERRIETGFRPLCKECQELRNQERDREWEERRRLEAERSRVLRSMPYKLYLQTDEWAATRTAALRRARYACQLCKGNGMALDVHHNTYERRGSEMPSDLVVMCRDCHSKHHDKLVGAQP